MSEPIDSEIIEIGCKVRIVCKDENKSDYYGKPIIGIIINQNLECYENSAPYAVIRLVLMEPNEQQYEFAYVRVNDILKIELLQEAPESITDLIANSPSGSIRNDIAKTLLKIIAIMEV